jgi:hypothetical protein
MRRALATEAASRVCWRSAKFHDDHAGKTVPLCFLERPDSKDCNFGLFPREVPRRADSRDSLVTSGRARDLFLRFVLVAFFLTTKLVLIRLAERAAAMTSPNWIGRRVLARLPLCMRSRLVAAPLGEG